MEEGTSILHYKIPAKLGEEGMGVVYIAGETKLDRTVALKFLPSTNGDSEEDVQRFIREAKTSAAQNHPHICTIHQIEEHKDPSYAPKSGASADTRWFIAMEYVEGQTLKEKLQESALPVDLAIQYAIQTSGALAEGHDREIVHRDIKSANIIITLNGKVKIMDFGLAQISTVATKLTKEGATLGTVSYMSPEQTRGIQTDHRSDIWSFGVVLYEMLTGSMPFRGDYEQSVIYSILNEQPSGVSALAHSGKADCYCALGILGGVAPKEVLGECKKVAMKAIELDSNYHYAHWTLGRAYLQKEEYQKALDEFSKVKGITIKHGSIGHVYAVSGDEEKARKILEELLHSEDPDYITAYQIALIYTGLNEKDNAFKWLNRAYKAKSPLMVWVNQAPEFKQLFDDPRWNQLLKQMKLIKYT